MAAVGRKTLCHCRELEENGQTGWRAHGRNIGSDKHCLRSVSSNTGTSNLVLCIKWILNEVAKAVRGMDGCLDMGVKEKMKFYTNRSS